MAALARFFSRKKEEEPLVVPSPEFIESLKYKHSPDAVRLLAHEYQPVFVYDEMMSSMPQRSILGEDANKECVAFTMAPFLFWKKKLGEATFPIPLDPPERLRTNPPWAKQREATPVRIRGELYSVKSIRIVEDLDKYRENGVQFTRRKVLLSIPHTEITVDKNKSAFGTAIMSVKEDYRRMIAWMYVGKPDYWHEHIDAGYSFSPVRVFEANSKKNARFYSQFTPLEYEDL